MRYLILTIFVLFSFQAKGEVDGWKDFKFGMSKGEVKDLLIRYQKNNKLRTEEGKYGIIPCGIKEIFEQGLYEYFIDCFKIGNINLDTVSLNYTSENKLSGISLEIAKIKPFPRILSAYSKKYKLYKKWNLNKKDYYVFGNGQIYMKVKPKSRIQAIRIYYQTQSEAKKMKVYVDGLSSVEDDI